MKMEEGFWVKYGFKEDGSLVCVRAISNTEPCKTFFYTEKGESKEVRDSNVIKLTKELIEKFNNLNKELKNDI
jgi:hypothetical protein